MESHKGGHINPSFSFFYSVNECDNSICRMGWRGGGAEKGVGQFRSAKQILGSQSQSTLHIFYAACFHSYFHTHEQLACDKNFHYTVSFF